MNECDVHLLDKWYNILSKRSIFNFLEETSRKICSTEIRKIVNFWIWQYQARYDKNHIYVYMHICAIRYRIQCFNHLTECHDLVTLYFPYHTTQMYSAMHILRRRSMPSIEWSVVIVTCCLLISCFFACSCESLEDWNFFNLTTVLIIIR